MKKMQKRWLTILLVLVMVTGGALSTAAAVTIQRSDVQSGTKVTGEWTTNFTFSVKSNDDTFDIYKIANMVWDGVNNTYQAVSWVTEVQTWIATSVEFNTATFQTPVALGSATEEEIIRLMSAIREDATLMASLAGYKVADANIAGPADPGDGSISYTVSNVNFGLYLVDAENTVIGRKYQPVLVDVIPQQEGPTGNWYLQNEISAVLKYESIRITKEVNGEDYDIVKKGETVNFEITAPIPDYPDGSTKLYNINDDMSEGYTYVDTTGVVEYRTSAGGAWQTLAPAAYTALWAPVAQQYGITGGDVFAYAVPAAGTNFTYYGLVNGKMSSLGTYSDTAGSWTTIRNAYQTQTGTTVPGTIEKLPLNKSLINVSFSYDQLKALGATDVRIAYSATINDNVVLGADTNTNAVKLFYQEDSSGTQGTTEDIVKTWTYGVNIVKEDGQVEEGIHTYLAGAVFSLYRLSDTYCSGTTGAGSDAADYTDYHWYSNQDGALSAAEAGTPATLDQVAYEAGTYFFLPVDVEAGQCNDNPAAHKHIQVYKLLESGITSVGDAEGVTVKGLDPAEYLLLETQAPEGYNALSEGIIFSIEKLGAEEAEADGGSYKGFVDDERNVISDGVYDIVVKNYTGVQLPATGGMGTTIFIVLGIAIMGAAAMTLLIVRRRKQFVNQ